MSRKKYIIPKQIIKRSYSIISIFVIIYGFLIYRLVDIQILKGNLYKQKAENQNTEKIELNSGRGVIYDRNGEPLTDVVKNTIIVVEKQKLISDLNIRELIKDATSLNESELYKQIEEQISSSILKIKVDNLSTAIKSKLEENDILVEEETLRYSSDGLLANTIGYISVSDKIGISGIEKSLDYLLKGSNEDYVSVFKAGQSGGNSGNENVSILKGSIKNVSDSEDEKNVKLTIDKNIQKIVENIALKEENPTAIIVSDSDTGEILAMSSMPTYDQNDIYNSMKQSEELNNGAFLNRTVQVTYPPGSVFKIVVLYAALESGVISEDSYNYNCTGSTKVGNSDEMLKCHNLKGHGVQTLQQAFSNSCNTAFLDIAMKAGKEKIISSAQKLHLDESIDIGLEEEKSGSIPSDIEIRNLAIGQGSIGFTPLQINQLTQIVANNGTYKPLYLYDSVVDKNKEIVKIFKNNKSEEIISPYIMTRIKEIMKDVSINGTAKDLANLKGISGVKTGTAQSSLNGTKINHGWITGFYTNNNTQQYTITIVVEGTEENSKSAVPIFKAICEEINKK
ncbi:MAG: penicillin-binding protein 2 [Clostridium sp.]|nr:penicillin-binding protein 2 [Clostridium sp.]